MLRSFPELDDYGRLGLVIGPELVRREPPDIGIQTRVVLSATRRRLNSGETGAPRVMTEDADRYARSHSHSAGNGALMRTALVALNHLDDRIRLAEAGKPPCTPRGASVTTATRSPPIAGGPLGARWGASAVPWQWRRAVSGCARDGRRRPGRARHTDRARWSPRPRGLAVRRRRPVRRVGGYRGRRPAPLRRGCPARHARQRRPPGGRGRVHVRGRQAAELLRRGDRRRALQVHGQRGARSQPQPRVHAARHRSGRTRFERRASVLLHCVAARQQTPSAAVADAILLGRDRPKRSERSGGHCRAPRPTASSGTPRALAVHARGADLRDADVLVAPTSRSAVECWLRRLVITPRLGHGHSSRPDRFWRGLRRPSPAQCRGRHAHAMSVRTSVGLFWHGNRDHACSGFCGRLHRRRER